MSGHNIDIRSYSAKSFKPVNATPTHSHSGNILPDRKHNTDVVGYSFHSSSGRSIHNVNKPERNAMHTAPKHYDQQQVPRMDLADIHWTIPGCYLFVGRSGSGKTTLIKAFYEQMQNRFHRVILFCPTADCSADYDFIEPKNKLPGLDPTAINKIIEYQNKLPKDKRPSILFILDDLLGSDNTTHNDLIDSLAAKARHYSITMLVATQLATKVSTTVRDNSNCIFLSYPQRIDALFQTVDTAMFKTKHMFAEFAGKNIKDYTTLAICNDPKQHWKTILINQVRLNELPVEEEEVDEE